MADSPPGEGPPTDESLSEAAIDVLLTGFAVIVPLVITLYVLQVALGFVTNALGPVIATLQYFDVISGVRDSPPVAFLVESGIFDSVRAFLTEIIAVFVLVGIVVAVGVVTRNRYGERLVDYFDAVIMTIPGVGSIYKSFRRMSDTMMESDVENFRDVKLVEFPRDGWVPCPLPG